ncbi:hypothetical protein [Nonomuraea salmonea]|uniref:hypothetical protein n=1 Tax=Nonomuraea salmonea TaxID=46181 RepID=UPI002FEB4959
MRRLFRFITPALAGLLTLTGVAGHARAAAPERLGEFYGQRLAWSRCGDGYECGKLSVPLDYKHPEGDRIGLSMARLPATGRKIGSIVLNFGGPGASGVDTLLQSKDIVSPAIREHFDVVSFDPRGVGGSAPIHCMKSLDLDSYFTLDPTPDTASEVKRQEKVGQSICKNRAPSGRERNCSPMWARSRSPATWTSCAPLSVTSG